MDYEGWLIGALLSAADLCREELFDAAAAQVTASDFLSRPHAAVYAAIAALNGRGLSFTPQAVSWELTHNGTIGAIPGIESEDLGLDQRSIAREWLEVQADSHPTTAGLETYAVEVRRLSRLRQLSSAQFRVSEQAMDVKRDPDALIADTMADLAALTPRDHRRARFLRDIVLDDLPRFTAFLERPNQMRGYASGLPLLDFTLNGWEPGRLIMPAAGTSHGKSLFMLRVARGLAERGHPVLYVTLEMTPEQAKNRLIYSHAGISESSLRRQQTLTTDQGTAIIESSEYVADLPIILDAGDADWYSIRNRIEEAVQRDGVQVVFVDHIDLVQHRRQEKENRHSQIQAISSGMKNLALKLGVPVIAATQVNRQRQTSGRKSSIPTLSDLRESGSKEENADIVLILHRPAQEAVQQNQRPPDADPIWHDFRCFVAKNRDGETPLIQCYVDIATQRLEEWSNRYDIS